MTERETESDTERQIKVARLIDEYNLDGLGEEMARRWTAEDDRWSLRDSADHFNQAILEAAMEAEGAQLPDGEAENTYRLLTNEDVGEADKTRARRRLEREDIEVDTLLDDFVSYQAIRTFLTKHQGAEYTPDETDPLERETKNVQKLRGHIDSVTEGKLEQLRDSDELTLGEFRTLVDVRVVCEDCNRQFDVVELLEREGCDCDS
jgi:hypothetical protein